MELKLNDRLFFGFQILYSNRTIMELKYIYRDC